jgi:hypothetical protein
LKVHAQRSFWSFDDDADVSDLYVGVSEDAKARTDTEISSGTSGASMVDKLVNESRLVFLQIILSAPLFVDRLKIIFVFFFQCQITIHGFLSLRHP